MAGRELKIKMGYRQLEAMAMLHRKLADVFKPQPHDHHQILLAAHLKQMVAELEAMLRKDQNFYTWKFDDVKDLAFCQIWELVNAEINGTDYEALQLQTIKNTIDKHRKDKYPRDYYETVKAHTNAQQRTAPQEDPPTGFTLDDTEIESLRGD